MAEKISLESTGHGCTCGQEAGMPELDARTIPHTIRHGAIFGALGQLPVGGAMVLVAPHNPTPLLAQISEKHGEAFTVTYLQEGPQDWRLQFTRVN